MRMSEGVEWAIHCCSLLANLPEDARLSKSQLAEFFELQEHYLAKFLQKLSAGGLVHSSRGAAGGYRLAKAAASISLLDIVFAIDGDERFFRCTEIRRCGPTRVEARAYTRPCGIANAMWRAERAWRNELAQTSLEEIRLLGIKETPPVQLRKSADWFRRALS